MPFDIDASLAAWQKSLLDTSGRNPLIRFVAGRGGGTDLLVPSATVTWAALLGGQTLRFPWKRDLLGLPADIVDEAPSGEEPGLASKASAPSLRELTRQCLASPRLEATCLLTDFSDKKLDAHLRRLHRQAAEAETEHGVHVLYAVAGVLRWYEDESSQVEQRSPLVLVPVQLRRELSRASWTLVAQEDDPRPNLCLAERLRGDFRWPLPLLDADGPDLSAPEGLAAYLARVEDAVRLMPRWAVQRDLALGLFNFQKLAMWDDLQQNAERIRAHPLCRAVAGDPGVRLPSPARMLAARELDEAVSPEAAVHILDADSSQHEAIDAVLRGANAVVDGPPGTGKSQTIANLVAGALEQGKTVLFVSEKTAALEVVKTRLDACGLGDFCLELHSHKASKRAVLAELGRCLELVTEPAPEATDHRSLAAARNALNAYVAALHRPRLPLGKSVFQVHGELARLASVPGDTRWTAEQPLGVSADVARQGRELLERLVSCRQAAEHPERHPWRGCRLEVVSPTTRKDATFHLAQVAAAAAQLAGIIQDLAPRAQNSVPGWRAALLEARHALAVPLVPEAWFAVDPRAVGAAVQEMHRVVIELRSIERECSGFAPSRLRALTPEKAEALVAATLPDGECLVDGETLGLRERVDALREVARTLRTLGGLLGALDSASQGVLGALRFPARSPIADVRRYAWLAAELAKLGPLQLSWWEPARRAEVFAVVEQAAREAEAVQALRTSLVRRLRPTALAPDAAPVVEEALRLGDAFWRRLDSRWRGVRQIVVGWYVGTAPDQAGLMADLATLREYHRRSATLGAIASEYAPDLALLPTGRPDWKGTLDGLQAMARFDTWRLPAELQAAAAPGGGLDRAKLGHLAAALEAAEERVRAAWGNLLLRYEPPEAEVVWSKSPTRVAAELEREVVALDREADALAAVGELLLPGHNLPPYGWAAPLGRIREAVVLRSRLLELAPTVGLPPSTPELEAMDWTSLAEAAEALHLTLANSDRLEPWAVEVWTKPEVRARVTAAVGVSDEVLRAGFEASWSHVAGHLFAPTTPMSTGIVLDEASLEELARWAASRAEDVDRIGEWVQWVRLQRDARALGIEPVLEEVCKGKVSIEHAADVFWRRLLELWLDAVHEQEPVLKRFQGDEHDQLVRRFADLDRRQIAETPARLRARLIAQAHDPARASAQHGVLLRETRKARGHRPLRLLFGEVPAELLRIKPCLMMSPLAVSTYLASAPLVFDLVIFDEASQVRPHDAICAVYRGQQLVVAGDPKQLPPTDFFVRGADEEETEVGYESGTEGLESLLDVWLATPGVVRRQLRWHYRSRREGLIAFSNHAFYEGRLVTFPGADDATGAAVTFERVPGGVFEDGVNVAEVRRVVERVLAHARAAPDRSLGVIAFSERQQQRILDELEAVRRTVPELGEFFREDRPNPFFVKNLENVQGDERDVVLLSVGYGPDRAGKVSMNFGPLNRQGGERRLNVAITRARYAMHVVASLTAADIDVSRIQNDGPKLLRAFLDYAERGPVALAGAVTEANQGGFDSPFEQAVHDALVREGYVVHRQVGCGGYRIDLAVVDPSARGRYLLGIECDGATYHASATARDRDRLRQEVLEGLGWTICRIWSTDWIRSPAGQIERVRAALERGATSSSQGGSPGRGLAS